MTVYIYGLWDPRNYQLRYIGKSVNPEHRFRGHLDDAKYTNNKSYKCSWIRQLLSEGLIPSMEILEECTDDNWQEAEIAWIKEGREKGLNLTNISNGGDQPPNWNEFSDPEAARIKRNKTKKERGIKPPNLGRKWSQEYKDKMSKALSGENNPMYGLKGKNHPAYGNKMSEEFKKNTSKRMKGKNNPMYGKTHTDEAKRKLSIAGKGRKQTDEDKLKKSLSCKMHHAQKKGNDDLVVKLQQEYFNNFGIYHQRYLSYV